VAIGKGIGSWYMPTLDMGFGLLDVGGPVVHFGSCKLLLGMLAGFWRCGGFDEGRDIVVDTQ
jgi:hypothetical protein